MMDCWNGLGAGRRAGDGRTPHHVVRKEAAKDACRPHVLGLSPCFGLLSPGPVEEARTPVPHSCPPAGPPISVAKPCSGRGGLDLGTAEREGKGGLQRTRHHWRIWNYPSEEGAWSRRVIEVWPRGVCPPGFPGTAPSSRRSLLRSKRGAFAGGGNHTAVASSPTAALSFRSPSSTPPLHTALCTGTPARPPSPGLCLLHLVPGWSGGRPGPLYGGSRCIMGDRGHGRL